MKYFHTNIKSFPGSKTINIWKEARKIYKLLCSKTKRRPYVRSKYFDNQKIFIDHFWDHIQTKNWGDRMRRLKQYPCAIDLIENINNGQKHFMSVFPK